MSNLKALFKKYWHIVFVLYFPIYMAAFVALEKKSFDNYTFMHCAIDDMIPFCRFFIVPYILWFAYMAVFLVFFFFYSREEFISYAWYLIIETPTVKTSSDSSRYCIFLYYIMFYYIV